MLDDEALRDALLSPVVAARLWPGAYSPSESKRHFRESTEKAMRECESDWVKWRQTGPFANMASRSFKLFRKVKVQRFCSIAGI